LPSLRPAWLLKPKQRTRSGYRLYANRDFRAAGTDRGAEILGIPLKQSRVLEGRFEFGGSAAAPAGSTERKAQQLDKAIRAIAMRNMRSSLRESRFGAVFQLVVQEHRMQNSQEWKAQYFSAERGPKLAERQGLVARVSRNK